MMATEKELEFWNEIIKLGDEKRRAFISQMLAYVKTHPKYETLDKDQLVTQTIWVLLGDIGAAQAFLDVINVPYDLYLRTSK